MDNTKEPEQNEEKTGGANDHDALVNSETSYFVNSRPTRQQSDRQDSELEGKNEAFMTPESAAEGGFPTASADTSVVATSDRSRSEPPSTMAKITETDFSGDSKILKSDDGTGEAKESSSSSTSEILVAGEESNQQATGDGSGMDAETPVVTIVTEPGTSPSLAIVAKGREGEKKQLPELLSDAGQFSYASVCALALSSLFNDSHNRQWVKMSMNSIIVHLKLPPQVESAMNAFLEGFGKDHIDSLINTLLEEPVLHRNTILLAEDLVTLALKDGIYDSRMRVLIYHVAWLLRVKWEHLEKFEEALVASLETTKENETEEEKKAKAKKEKIKKVKRYALIGLATVGGGAAIGVTAGLAAPLVAAGVGAIIGGTSAAVLGTTAAAAIMGSLFGAAGAGLTGYKMKKRIGAIEEFDFDRLTEGHHLHITIAISGWLSDSVPDNFHKPWASLTISKEQYCLRWESSYLLDLGRAIEYILSGVMSFAASEALKLTILSGILTALAWPASLLSVSSVIDNPWSVAISRATEVGKHLATVLLSRQQGRRPVTLIGFSLGARVIYYCLEEMAKHKGCEGIIEDVILLGAPVSGNSKVWKSFSKVVAGRIINGYCRGDWLLQFVYRTASVQMNIAGLRPIEWNERRMVNVDLSHLVSGHTDYWKRMDEILEAIGVNTTAFSRSRRPSLQEATSQGGPSQGGPKDEGQTKATATPMGDLAAAAATATITTTSLEDEANVGDPPTGSDGSDDAEVAQLATQENQAEVREDSVAVSDGLSVAEIAMPVTKEEPWTEFAGNLVAVDEGTDAAEVAPQVTQETRAELKDNLVSLIDVGTDADGVARQMTENMEDSEAAHLNVWKTKASRDMVNTVLDRDEPSLPRLDVARQERERRDSERNKDIESSSSSSFEVVQSADGDESADALHETDSSNENKSEFLPAIKSKIMNIFKKD